MITLPPPSLFAYWGLAVLIYLFRDEGTGQPRADNRCDWWQHSTRHAFDRLDFRGGDRHAQISSPPWDHRFPMPAPPAEGGTASISSVRTLRTRRICPLDGPAYCLNEATLEVGAVPNRSAGVG